MTDSEKLAMVYKHIDERLADLSIFILIYENGQSTTYEQIDYLMALGERRALMELSHMLMGVQP